MTSLDAAVQTAFPVLAVPASGALCAPAACGTRYLVGRDGVSRETWLPWIRVCELVAPSALTLPYGRVQDAVEFRCGPIPDRVLREFMHHAKKALPNEMAGALLWNASDDSWRYLTRPSCEASGAHVRYQEVRPQPGEHLVVDLHSHGLHSAFFSEEDDADDAGAMKVSLVLGNVDQLRPTSRMRLCMASVVRTAYLRADGRLAVLP
ncbi:MAG TPA: PRTRC system protein A [Ramlibacter sp.]|jgi:PRTRC genetic system protein A|nr:PRTRC system protein A [Ramlibacter sp.]